MTLTTTTSTLADFITPSAHQAKADAITTSKAITVVSTPQQQADAIAAASLSKGLLRDLEWAREKRKRPVLDEGTGIDNAAKAFGKELVEEVKRVEKMASDFQREEDRKSAALRAEEERKQQQQREAEQRERVLEAAALRRLQDEADAARRADLARIEAAADAVAKEEAQRLADEAAIVRAEEARLVQLACREAEGQRMDAARTRHIELQTIVPAKPAQAVVQRRLNYELKDLRALHAARPDLVELSERRALILAAIAVPGAAAIPGIYVFEETKVQSKAS